jgi:hypothetical protein
MADHQDGQSTAAWTAVAIELLATLLISLAVVLGSWPLAIVGVVLIVVGAAAGKILASAGFGQTRPDRTSSGTAESSGGSAAR